MIETICFNPLLIPDAIKFYTPIAVIVVKFPPFRVHQQVKYPGFLPQVGGGAGGGERGRSGGERGGAGGERGGAGGAGGGVEE